MTEDGTIPLVSPVSPGRRDARPRAPERAIEDGETPADAARRELLEETGCESRRARAALGRLHVDSGRLETQQWAFFAPDVRVVDDHADRRRGARVLFVQPGELRALILSGEFNLAAHVAMVGLAVLSGRLAL